MIIGTYPNSALRDLFPNGNESWVDRFHLESQAYARESIPWNELASLCDKALETKDNPAQQN